jgi:uncharacterized protein
MSANVTRAHASDVAFSAAVKDVQKRRGSRSAYARMENGDGWPSTIDDQLAAFLAEQTSFFLATANAAGQPYIQHRGGPPGFVRVLDESTLGLADFRGNKQYITTGNLAENPKVHLFFVDYAQQQRIKLWGEARVVEDDPELLASLMPADYKARPEQALIIRVAAWDINCPQHIPRRFEAADVEAALAKRDARIAELEAELARLRRPAVR